MEFPLGAKFVARHTGASLQGFVRIAVEADLLRWTRWRDRIQDEDKVWDWWRIYLECGLSANRYECYAALAANELQGLMVLDLKERRIERDRGIAIDYLSTNPENRTLTHGLKYVGIALIAVAVARSFERGCHGGIWLESLPGAESFYNSLGMIKQARTSPDGNAIYILKPGTAKELLEELRGKGIVTP